MPLIATFAVMTLIGQAIGTAPPKQRPSKSESIADLPIGKCGFPIDGQLLKELAGLSKLKNLTKSGAEKIALAYKEHLIGAGGVLHAPKRVSNGWAFPVDGCLGPMANNESILVLRQGGGVSMGSSESFHSVKAFYDHLLTLRSTRTLPLRNVRHL